MTKLLVFVIAVFCYLATTFGVFISNLNESCFRCLCHVAGCDMAHSCTDGYCGPFYISRVYWVDAGKPVLPEDDPDRREDIYISHVYWVDAGKPVLPEDDPNRREAYQDCAKDYYCSIKIVENYMAKFGQDCNGDGVTDCFDYMMINHHGGAGCSAPLHHSHIGRRRLALFSQCRFT